MKLDCTTDAYEDLYARWLVDPGKLLKLGGLKPGERVIDLCGGTGIVGQTALDWGASYVVVADLNPRIRRWSDGRLQPVVARAEAIDVAMRFVEDRLAQLRGEAESESDSEQVDEPFDLVVCRQAIGYLDVEKTAQAVTNVLRPGGRFVFNAFKKPKFALKSYAFDGARFFEASGFFGRTVFHVQASPKIGVDVTKFKWHREDDLDRALRPYFEISKSSTEKSLYYVCTKRGHA
jgi:SAM-dependent methyltransferase